MGPGAGASGRDRALAVLDEVGRAIEGLERPVITKLRPVLAQAQAEIADNLREWLAREGGAARYTAQRYRNALVAVKHARGAIARLKSTTEGALSDVAAEAGPMALQHLEMEWLKFGEIFEGTIQPISLDQARIIAKADRVLIDRFPSSAARYAGSIRDDIIRELAVSRVKTESIFELTNRLERRLPAVFQGQRYRAERLARTETLNAYNEFHSEGLKAANKDDPEIVARWDASFDYRRCPICASLDGQTRNVAKGEKFVAEWTSFSKKKGARLRRLVIEKPPGHPQCRCVITAWHESWSEYARRRTPADPRTLAAGAALEAA